MTTRKFKGLNRKPSFLLDLAALDDFFLIFSIIVDCQCEYRKIKKEGKKKITFNRYILMGLLRTAMMSLAQRRMVIYGWVCNSN